MNADLSDIPMTLERLTSKIKNASFFYKGLYRAVPDYMFYSSSIYDRKCIRGYVNTLGEIEKSSKAELINVDEMPIETRKRVVPVFQNCGLPVGFTVGRHRSGFWKDFFWYLQVFDLDVSEYGWKQKTGIIDIELRSPMGKIR